MALMYVRVRLLCTVVFFLCKQTTAYEMRISDWRSDVCSSDLLDRAGAPLRIRGGATVTQVVHEGRPADAEHVLVTYARDGKLRKIRARSVVMVSGGWVNRTIVGDLHNSHRQAYRAFHYGPVMIANVALRHWRFFARLGFTAARWFKGPGLPVSVRRNVPLGPPLAPPPPATSEE